MKKLQYLYHTKELIRDKIISTGSGMPYDETFRNYPKWIKGIGGDWILKRLVAYKKSPVTIWLQNTFLEQWFAPTFRKMEKAVYHVYRRFFTHSLQTSPSHSASYDTAGTVNKSFSNIVITAPTITVYKQKGV